MKKILVNSLLCLFVGYCFVHDADAVSEVSNFSETMTAKKSDVKVRFSAKDHKGMALTGKSIELLNVVLTEMPMSAIRMFKAAVSAKKVLNKIEEVKAAGVSLKKAKEIEFIKNCISTVLDPVRDFFVNLKAYKTVIGGVFKQSLGENAEKGLLVKSLDQKDDLDIMAYLLVEISSIDDLESAVSEFLIFFSDVEASLTDEARKAYSDTLAKLKEAQKASESKMKK